MAEQAQRDAAPMVREEMQQPEKQLNGSRPMGLSIK
jgi:hypothetical protein